MLYVDIEKKYGSFSLRSSFEMKDDVMGLLGASGSGKSLTLKAIAGIEKPDSGKIQLNGRTLFDSDKNINLRPQDRKVGYLFQNHALFPNMTVMQNVMAGVKEKSASIKREKAGRILSELNIAHIKDRYPGEISGGESQRAALGRVLVNMPDIVLLDEPFSALDEYLRWKVQIDVFDILKKHGVPSILVTHSRDEAYRNCKSICVINNGRTELNLPKEKLFSDPETYASCLISGCKNFSGIKKLSKNRVYAEDFGIELVTADEVLPKHRMIGIRSRDIVISSRVFSENHFELKLDRIVEETFADVLMFLPPCGAAKYMRAQADKKNSYKQGEMYTANINSDKIMLLE